MESVNKLDSFLARLKIYETICEKICKISDSKNKILFLEKEFTYSDTLKKLKSLFN